MLEDFGVLQLQEYVSIAKVVNARSPRQSMQLFTVDQSDLQNIKLNVYKIKRVYQSLQQVVKDKIKKQWDQKETNNNPHWLDQAIY